MKSKRFRFPISAKLICGFMAVLLLLATVAVIAIVQFKKVDEQYTGLLSRRSMVIENVLKLKSEAVAQENAVRGLLLTGDTAYLNDFNASKENFNQAFEEFAPTAPNESARKQIADLKEAYDDYLAKLQEIIQLHHNNPEAAVQLLKTDAFNKARANFHQHADGILTVANNVMAEDQANANNRAKFVNQLLNSAMVVSLLLGLLISLAISRSIAKPILSVSKTMSQLADGNFSSGAEAVKSRDEIGDLVNSLNQMVHDLRNILAKVSESGQYIVKVTEELEAASRQSSATSDQVAQVSQQNAQGAEKQLQTFQQTAAKVNQIAQGVVHIAQSSGDMQRVAKEAAEITKNGSNLISHVVQQMDEINAKTKQATEIILSLDEHSKNISEIITFITSLSEQTNLLALNAAIEAARAGEQGKGFAVVAAEVRQLAEESRQSAERVIEMIGHIQQGINLAAAAMQEENRLVTDGLAQISQTQQAFETIESSIEQVTAQVEKVTQSVEEIKENSMQITTEIKDVHAISEEVLHLSQESAQATEEQLAAMQEMAASIQNLAHLAEELQQHISRFKF